MSTAQIADSADMIVAGFAYKVFEDYIEVVDLGNPEKRAVIQNGDVVESLMSDEEDDVILAYYNRNREILEESLREEAAYA